MQLVGELVALQEIVLLPPLLMVLGLTLRVMVGLAGGAGGVAETATVADELPVPPALVHARVYVYVFTVDSVPVD